MITDLKIWDDEQPKATYPPMKSPVDKRVFWLPPPYRIVNDLTASQTEWEYVQKLIDAGTTYSYWYDRPVSVLAVSLGIV